MQVSVVVVLAFMAITTRPWGVLALLAFGLCYSVHAGLDWTSVTNPSSSQKGDVSIWHPSPWHNRVAVRLLSATSLNCFQTRDVSVPSFTPPSLAQKIIGMPSAIM